MAPKTKSDGQSLSGPTVDLMHMTDVARMYSSSALMSCFSFRLCLASFVRGRPGPHGIRTFYTDRSARDSRYSSHSLQSRRDELGAFIVSELSGAL